jgi:hypothetical protein
VNLAREYMHHRSGYRFGTRCYWVRIYKGEPRDAPVVVCSPSIEIGAADDTAEASGYLAAEVIHEFFAGGLPDLPHPLLWIEHRPAAGAAARVGTTCSVSPPTVPNQKGSVSSSARRWEHPNGNC